MTLSLGTWGRGTCHFRAGDTELILLREAEHHLHSVGECRTNPIATGSKIKSVKPSLPPRRLRRLPGTRPKGWAARPTPAETQAGNSDSFPAVSTQAERPTPGFSCSPDLRESFRCKLRVHSPLLYSVLEVLKSLSVYKCIQACIHVHVHAHM